MKIWFTKIKKKNTKGPKKKIGKKVSNGESRTPSLRPRCLKPVELYFWIIERYIREKQAWFWQLKLYFNSFRRISRTCGRQASGKTVAKSLATSTWRPAIVLWLLSQCTKSAHRWTGTIYDSCRFDIGRFRAEPTYLRKVLYLSDTFAYRSAHNNLFLTLRVIHKLKSNLNRNSEPQQIYSEFSVNAREFNLFVLR